MKLLRRICQVAAIVLAGLSTGISTLRSATLPDNFHENQWGTNVGSAPTAMAFAPDGRLFVCLQGGQVRVITSDGMLLPTPFVTVKTKMVNERGLGGIAFDPDFPNNQFVYFYYTVGTDPAHNRVSRFTAKGDVAVSGSETVLLELNDLTDNSSHNGGAIHFGLDGKLYVAVGENRNPDNSQSVDNLLGKMLRINSDGTIPDDNPEVFPGIQGTPSGVNRAIWAVGLRNPFTFAFQPGTGRMFINDVGELAIEEINDGMAGSNYGWDLCEGSCVPPNPDYRDPVFEYHHGAADVSGCAIVGGTFYNPEVEQFPESYVGKYFFSDFCNGWIRVLDLTDYTASHFARGISFAVDVKVGPDGCLYYLTRGNGGQVFRIFYMIPPTPTPPPAQELNISTRLKVGTDDKAAIGGFIVTGQTAKPLVLRGIGPSLTQAGVPAAQALLDPVLELRGSAGVYLINDNWRDGPFSNLIEGTIYQPTDDREAVVLAAVQPGGYTATLTGKNGSTGIGLVEAYDFDLTAHSKLSNISTRGFIGTQDDVMIGGFFLGGSSTETHVAIRGIGPSLSQFGLTDVLADPTIELHDSNGTIIVTNDNWRDDPLSASSLIFNGLGLRDDHEAGLYLQLSPGAFTVIMAGKNGGTGTGLVEIYDIQ